MSVLQFPADGLAIGMFYLLRRQGIPLISRQFVYFLVGRSALWKDRCRRSSQVMLTCLGFSEEVVVVGFRYNLFCELQATPMGKEFFRPDGSMN